MKRISLTALALVLTTVLMAQGWVDITSSTITNPSYDNNSKAGWTIEKTRNGYYTTSNTDTRCEAQESWYGAADIYQIITLPQTGKYRLSVNGFFRDGTTDNETAKKNNGEELKQLASLVAINGNEEKVSALLPSVSSEAGQMPGVGDVVNSLELANWPWQANEYFQTGLYKATTATIEVGDDGKLAHPIESPRRHIRSDGGDGGQHGIRIDPVSPKLAIDLKDASVQKHH